MKIELFKNDGGSDLSLIEPLIKLYRYHTSVNPLMIQELKTLINIKKNNPHFYYLNEMESGYFTKEDGSIHVGDKNVATLAHETGHAMHFYMTDFAIPENYASILNEIKNDSSFIDRVEKYSLDYITIIQNVYEKAKKIVEEKMAGEMQKDEKDKLQELY